MSRPWLPGERAYHNGHHRWYRILADDPTTGQAEVEDPEDKHRFWVSYHHLFRSAYTRSKKLPESP